MDLLVFAALYVAFMLALVFVLLWGEHEAFVGTPVAWAHWLLSSGVCEAAERAAGRLCGERGRDALSGLEACCCERRNPWVQLLFLVLLGGAFWVYWRDLFPLLPLPGLPAWHK